MAIQFYHRDDDGLPDYHSGGSNAQNFASFKVLLLACLVNGYGSKPAAGWELIAEGSNYLVLRTGNQSGYVGFQLVGEGVRIWLAQTFIEMSGSLMVGDGLKSGTAAGNATPQFKSLYGIASTSAPGHSWVAVADERTAIFNFSGWWPTNPDVEMTGVNGYTGACGLFYFGEDARGNLISCGGINSTTTSGSSVRGAWFDQRGFTALKDPSTGLLVDTGALGSVQTTPGTGTTARSKTAGFYGVFERAILVPVDWGNSGVWSSFRGVALPAQLGQFYASAAARALGLEAGLTFRTLNTPMPLGDEYGYWIAATSANEANQSDTLMITTNPEFW